MKKSLIEKLKYKFVWDGSSYYDIFVRRKYFGSWRRIGPYLRERGISINAKDGGRELHGFASTEEGAGERLREFCDMIREHELGKGKNAVRDKGQDLKEFYIIENL